MDDLDAVLPEQGGRADAGELEELRGEQCPGAEHHFPGGGDLQVLIAVAVGHPDRPPAVEVDPPDGRVGEDREVAALAGLFEEGL